MKRIVLHAILATLATLLLATLACGSRTTTDSIQVDENGVRCYDGGEPGPQVQWSQLVSAEIRTEVRGNYLQPYYVLAEADGAWCEFRAEIGNEAHGFLDRLGRLPGFDYGAFAAARVSTGNQRFGLWHGEKGDGLPAAERFVLSEAGVRRFYGDRLVDEARWADLVEVIVETTDEGPFFVDLFLVLVNADGTATRLPGDLITHALLDRISRLPGFDLETFVLAQGSAQNARFVCWRRVDTTPARLVR